MLREEMARGREVGREPRPKCSARNNQSLEKRAFACRIFGEASAGRQLEAITDRATVDEKLQGTLG